MVGLGQVPSLLIDKDGTEDINIAKRLLSGKADRLVSFLHSNLLFILLYSSGCLLVTWRDI